MTETYCDQGHPAHDPAVGCGPCRDERDAFATLRENPFEIEFLTGNDAEWELTNEQLERKYGSCTDCHYPFDVTGIGRPSQRDATRCVSCDDLRISAECDTEQTR